MNEDTRIAISCYAGDKHLVTQKLPYYLHHQRPVTVLSPSNASVTIEGLDNRTAGLAQHAGVASLDRHLEYLRTLLQFPETYFLFHDSDSICIDAELPPELYTPEHHYMVWSNLIPDDAPWQQRLYPKDFPKLAFAPPYFLSRQAIQMLVNAAPQVTPNPHMLYVDHYMVQLTEAAQLPYKCFSGGFTGAISRDVLNPRTLGSRAEDNYLNFRRMALQFTRHFGGNIYHSVKSAEPLAELAEARRLYLTKGPDPDARMEIGHHVWMSHATHEAVHASETK